MTSAAWLVGSVTLPDISFGFDGDDVELAGGTYYLRHTTAGLSLVDALNTAFDASLATPTCTSLVVLRNRRVQINLSGSADIDWSAGVNGAVLAAILGFVNSSGAALNQTGAASYTAAYPSPLLWSPGFLATPQTPAGTDGYEVLHQAVYKSDDGTQVTCVDYGEEVWQELGWSHILPERMRLADSVVGGGTFNEFYKQCAKLRSRFFYYEEIDEDDASTTAVTWTTGVGPYVLRPEFPADWYKRNVPNAEVSCSLELPIHRVAEYA